VIAVIFDAPGARPQIARKACVPEYALELQFRAALALRTSIGKAAACVKSAVTGGRSEDDNPACQRWI
jgi:hypothetical protein